MPVSFRERLRAGEPLVGTFIKTPTFHTAEVIGDVGFDFIVIDQEHGPFDRVATDAVLVGARAAGIAALVRVRTSAAHDMLGALDDGADGVIVPHVSTAEIARSVVGGARYRGGHRGFSSSPRAGRYGGASIWEHVDRGDANTAVVAMIEDPEALSIVDSIAAVDGIDALFIGRGDLTVALNAPSPDSPPIREAVERIAASGRAQGKALCVHTGRIDAAEIAWMRGLGVTAFIVSSDQGLMRTAATNVLSEFKKHAFVGGVR
ncbi:MAG: aldolase/citrate lyase family protein [Steroidobacteraceae bacterium]